MTRRPPIGNSMAEAEAARWGTWEELVLGAAVLRHGEGSWEAIASEVQTRILLQPHLFTHEACETKYHDLQGRYNGCDKWFEELRKLRVAELKRGIETSEGSIRSLQTELENLKAEKGDDGDLACGLCRLDFLTPTENVDGGESAGKNRHKDGSSAGSFTQDVKEVSRDLSEASQVPSVEAAEPEVDMAKMKLESSEELNKGKVGTLRKRRGRRRWKVCGGTKDGGGTGESEVLSSANDVIVNAIDETVGNREKIVDVASSDGGCIERKASRLDWLPQFLDCVMEHKAGAAFHRRLESQRKARYKKLIRRHLDLEMIRRSIDWKSYTTSWEMLRDLLLLLNNALVYYRKNSSEYNSAITLRQFMTKKFKELMSKEQTSDQGSVLIENPTPSPVKPLTLDKVQDSIPRSVHLEKPKANPVKPRSARPGKHHVAGKAAKEMRIDGKSGEKRPQLASPANRRAGPTANSSEGRSAKKLKGRKR